MSRRLLQELGIDGYFAAIAGRDTFAVSKPDPGHLTGTIALAGGDPSHALMIGDSEVDLRTAKAAGVPIVLVSFGYATAPLTGFRRRPSSTISTSSRRAPPTLLNGRCAQPVRTPETPQIRPR